MTTLLHAALNKRVWLEGLIVLGVMVGSWHQSLKLSLCSKQGEAWHDKASLTGAYKANAPSEAPVSSSVVLFLVSSLAQRPVRFGVLRENYASKVTHVSYVLCNLTHMKSRSLWLSECVIDVWAPPVPPDPVVWSGGFRSSECSRSGVDNKPVMQKRSA